MLGSCGGGCFCPISACRDGRILIIRIFDVCAADENRGKTKAEEAVPVRWALALGVVVACAKRGWPNSR